MKYFYTILGLIITSTAFGQVPTDYYTPANGLTGYSLKSKLNEIINDTNDGLSNEFIHNDQGDNLDPLYNTSDKDLYYENDNTILDIYSENPTGADPYNYNYNTDECSGNFNAEGQCYNKEHIIPKSVFNENSPMVDDAHQVVPTDGRVNGLRSNLPFGIVDDSQLLSQNGITNPTQNGSKAGGNLNSGVSAGYTGDVFEPIDEFKGDVARMYFYFATRYEDQVSAWSAYPMFDGSGNKVIADPFLNILLAWHQNDPVSQKEIDRNNVVFNYQNNRNPFVDHPEYVAQIWSTSSDTQAPTPPTNLVASNPTASTMDVSWVAATDNEAVVAYDVYVDNTFTISTNGTTTATTITGLMANTNYCFTVRARDAAGNTSGFSNQDCESTNNTAVADLFFSEYVEGTGTNKALEIANFTGNSITLSNYAIKIAFNSNSFTTTYALPNITLTDGNVYVIANSGLLAACQPQQDEVNNSITAFNGNDAIGLFKNNILIDLIGIEGDGNNFAKDVTLVRKQTVAFPSAVYDSSEWNVLSTNECSNLGSHVQALSVETFDDASITVYPNPVKTLLHIDLKENGETKVEIINILGKRVLNTTITASKTINVGELKTGVYILKIKQDTKSFIKRMVKTN